LYVLPSQIEGLPTTLLEAMSYGNCCLASDIEENVEALNGNGFTFSSGDVGSLCEAMKLLLSRPDLAESKKASAREYVLKNFSWDSISTGFERLYNELLAGKNVQDK
jgi:glycosyltransferase involved in cell wall biosynthesis